MSDMRHMLDLIGGPCSHGRQPAIECAICARAEVTALKARVAELEELISDGLAGGTDGTHRQACRCLWHEAARAVLSGSSSWLKEHDEEVRAKAIADCIEAVKSFAWATNMPLTKDERGILTFVDPRKVRRKRDFGRCYRRAGFEEVGATKGGLVALQLLPERFPAPTPAMGQQLSIQTNPEVQSTNGEKPMSVWDEIDKMKRKHEAEFSAAKSELESLGATKSSLTVDDYGQWRCRYIPKGERKQESLTARTHTDLVSRLKAIREREAQPRPEPKLAAVQ